MARRKIKMSDEMKRKPSESMEKFFNELKNLGLVRPAAFEIGEHPCRAAK